ncbi:hypothetical protein JCGZ_25435 [Jatropha curcas]|uniref:Uncharacterized protein n=1 Tax=Jatropha curcas TaxID=180498 RepID=A0A067JLD2_JATCU|nr:hypothetical protein JCGZ_25435 [Jatropha curcas]
MVSLERQRRARPRRAYPHARALEKGKNSLRIKDKHASGMPGSTPVLSARKSFRLRDREKHAHAVLENTPVPGAQEDNSDDEEAEAAGGAAMEEDNPPPFTSSFGAGTSGAGPSFQGTSNMSNDEVLARMMSRMDIFDTRLNGMETMIADRFQSIEIMNGSLDSRMDTMQGQLQTILQLLQPPPPPEH